MKYMVIDFYDRPVHGDLIGTFDSRKEAESFAKKYAIEECDGECDIEIKESEV